MDQETLRREAGERARLAQIEYQAFLEHGLGCCDVPGPVVAAIIIGASIDRLAAALDRPARSSPKQRVDPDDDPRGGLRPEWR